MAKAVKLIITIFTSILISVAFLKVITDLENTVANIDGLASAKKATHPDFYSAYYTARTGVDTGGGGEEEAKPSEGS